MDNMLLIENLCKTYEDHTQLITVLDNVSVSFTQGVSYAILGISGSGKSTLLHLIASLETPTSGNIIVNNQSILTLNSKQKSDFRQNVIGFVFQDHHLLQDFTAIENIIVPMLLAQVSLKEAKEKAYVLLEQIGLQNKANSNVNQLSGGERQRVAIARALANDPKLILADEPTGNLDQETGKIVANLLLTLCKKQNRTLLLVTHDEALAKNLDKQYKIESKQLHQV